MENRTDEDLHDVNVTMEQAGADEPLAGPWTRQVRQLPGRVDVGWDKFGDFVPAASALVHANEAFPVTYRGTVSVREGIAAQLTVRSVAPSGTQPFGVQRVSSARKQVMIRFIPTGYQMTRFGGTRFYWPSQLDPDSWRGFRRSQGNTDRKFDEIAPEEVANAILAARRGGRVRDLDEVHQVARDLGYGRLTENINRSLTG